MPCPTPPGRQGAVETVHYILWSLLVTASGINWLAGRKDCTREPAVHCGTDARLNTPII